MRTAQFRDALLSPDAPVPDGLTDPQGRPAGRRFNVYRNNVAVGLTEALRQSFPVVRKLVGEDFFTAMAQDHLRAHPPASPLMMFYGQDMPAFLEHFPPVAHLGYLPDIARLELAIRNSYHAADAPPLPPERIAALGADAMCAARFTLAPAVQLVRSRWPIHAIWSANTKGSTPPRTVRGEDVLITRPDFDPVVDQLDDGAAPFVARLLAGDRLDAAHAAAGPLDPTATLGLLLARGAITGLVEDPNVGTTGTL